MGATIEYRATEVHLVPLCLYSLKLARFCSHINFIDRCLGSKVIPKGFRSNFHASTFSSRRIVFGERRGAPSG